MADWISPKQQQHTVADLHSKIPLPVHFSAFP